MKLPTQRKGRTQGFTLAELVVAIAVLVALLAITFSMISKTQTTYRVESQKVDFTQQQREFIDQFTRDMHQAGYPTAAVQGLPAGAFTGIQNFNNTQVTMQGDLDGTGPQTITYDYNGGCNCLRRNVGVPGTAPVVAVENVIAPGLEQIFTAYDAAGKALTAPVNPASIRSIRVSFTVQGGMDANSRSLIQNTMTGMARLPNNN